MGLFDKVEDKLVKYILDDNNKKTKRNRDDLTPSPSPKRTSSKKKDNRRSAQRKQLTEKELNAIRNLNDVDPSQQSFHYGSHDSSEGNQSIDLHDDQSSATGSEERSGNCNLCKREAKDETIECENCFTWSHYECNNLSEEEFDMVGKLHGKMKFFCLNCKEDIDLWIKKQREKEEANTERSSIMDIQENSDGKDENKKYEQINTEKKKKS